MYELLKFISALYILCNLLLLSLILIPCLLLAYYKNNIQQLCVYYPIHIVLLNIKKSLIFKLVFEVLNSLKTLIIHLLLRLALCIFKLPKCSRPESKKYLFCKIPYLIFLIFKLQIFVTKFCFTRKY